MAHPFESHKQMVTEKKRVGHIKRSAGEPHDDAAADKRLFRELMAEHERKEPSCEKQ